MKQKHYHLVGICGVSMSGLAQLLAQQGNIVSGSDLRQCEIKNCQIFPNQTKNNITSDIEELIYTAAAEDETAPGFVELQAAREQRIKTTKRSKFIGKLMNDTIGVAVTGMHGKTTISTMISLILQAANYQPTCLIGSKVKEWGTNVLAGGQTNNDVKSQFYKSNKSRAYFVAEACEYDRQMLDFRPKVAVITNMEEEHLDTYTGGMPDIKQSFKKFVKSLPVDGLLVLCADDKNVASLKQYAKCKVKFYSLKQPWPGLKLKVLGKHNLQNATGAARVCHELGVSAKIIKQTLNNFTGAGRRLELKGEKADVIVLDDYAHHPTEIKATLQAVADYKKKNRPADSKIILVYQPHQQQRTKLLFADFVNSFTLADKIILTDVYKIAGREKEAKENLAEKLAQAIKDRGQDITYVSGNDKILKLLREQAKPGDIILTMGATDIYKIGEEYLA